MVDYLLQCSLLHCLETKRVFSLVFYKTLEIEKKLRVDTGYGVPHNVQKSL